MCLIQCLIGLSSSSAFVHTVCSDPRYMVPIDIPNRWTQSNLAEMKQPYSMRQVTLIDDDKTRKFMDDIGDPVSRLDGDSIPISKASIFSCIASSLM
jgi:hypothetical protein